MKFLIISLIYIILCFLVSISKSNGSLKQNNTKFNCGDVINCNNLKIIWYTFKCLIFLRIEYFRIIVVKPCCEKNGEYLCGYKGCPPGWKKI